MLDCIIIGGGPAGFMAAIYLIRKRMKIVLLSDLLGGQVVKAAMMENYLGFEKISGAEFSEKIITQAKNAGVEMKTGKVEKIEKNNNIFSVKTNQESIETKSIIICSGESPRMLNIPGEKEFLGRGVGYCVTCDGPLFSGKKVAVIGGGNSALDGAIEMEKYAEKVYILNLNESLQGDEVRVEQIEKLEKIEVINKAQTTEILGENFVQTLKYKDLNLNQEKQIDVSGIFVEVGWVPSSMFVKDLLDLNPKGEIIINKNNETSIPGIFAAGDVTDTIYKQLIIAAGEGAKAALSAWKYIVTRKNS